MKRILIFFTALLLLLTLSACNDNREPDPQPDTSSSSSEVTPENTSASETSQTTPQQTEDSSEEITTVPEETDKLGLSIAQTAEALIGIPFAENGSSPEEGFDNSGFIYYVLRENGFINCPRITPEQAAMGNHIGYDSLKAGDLAFFSTNDSGNPDFGGIYIGDGQLIYSPMPGQNVKIADITADYWRNSFAVGVSVT